MVTNQAKIDAAIEGVARTLEGARNANQAAEDIIVRMANSGKLLTALKEMVEAYWRGSEDSDDEHAPGCVKLALAAIEAAEGRT